MKTLVAVVLATLVLSRAVASDRENQIQGMWVLEGTDVGSLVTTLCPMSIDFLPDGRIVRTTGDLVYSTTFVLTPRHKGWLLTETLEGHNGMTSCRGETAEGVIRHLSQSAYLELDGTTLKYFRSPGQLQPPLRFSHVRSN